MISAESKKTFRKIGIWIVFPLGIFCLIAVGCATWKKSSSEKALEALGGLNPEAIQELNDGAYTVSRVIDGNTLALDNGEKVRLIGIKPTKEAPDFIRDLVEGHQVRLEHDVLPQDKDGAMLAYVWFQTTHEKPLDFMDPSTGKPFMIDDYKDAMLNEVLVKAGYAQGMIVPPNVKYQELFDRLEKEAREGKQELWK